MLKKLFIGTLLTIILSNTVQAKPMTFGSAIDEKNVSKVSTILAKPESYLGKQVTIRGMVTYVCEKRGCWMTVASDQKFQELYIKVPDGEMVFPISARGSNAIVTGSLKAVPLTLEETRGWLAEQAKVEGKSFDPASVTEPINFYELTPAGVKILE
ncbi:DUF4920 domain-containing protein [Shewanella sp. ZOR0012]|uniref:DUF4920 domain-containing protein n=1 Tax=Shewanella sp. ZOR0012 TaxID=1339231 RepID=UPI000647C812|nr:DUF4920 domain-containing protein [Shewanella sp. ZOR0012]NSM24604.1 DUF4920 domain-containing protein [Shewanella sp. ZOR0012]